MKVLPPLYLGPYSFISRTSSFLSEIDGLVSLELWPSVRYWDSKGNRKIIESAQNTFLLTLSPRKRHIFTAKENIPRRYQSFTEFHFLFATNTLKSINKYPAKGLAVGVGFEPTEATNFACFQDRCNKPDSAILPNIKC